MNEVEKDRYGMFLSWGGVIHYINRKPGMNIYEIKAEEND